MSPMKRAVDLWKRGEIVVSKTKRGEIPLQATGRLFGVLFFDIIREI
jgi:hypothetical protein